MSRQRESPEMATISWRFLLRVVVKTLLLFAVCNLLFAAFVEPEDYGRISLYNHLWPGRKRLPYGENVVDSYNLSLNNIPALFASHELAQPKTDDEFRVLLLGDSSVWGWLLPNDQTLAAHLNHLDLQSEDGRTLIFYNVGYPVLSLSKDLLLLDEAMNYEPDLILWLVTLDSFVPEQQLNHPLLWHNAPRTRSLIQAYELPLDAGDERFVQPTFWQRTIVGQRQMLANWLRLQQLGAAWLATGVDQAIPEEFELRESDFLLTTNWQLHPTPITLTEADLTFQMLAAGVERAGEVPVFVVNEPIFISDGISSNFRYNAWYPHWAYDQYRILLAETAVTQNWHYIDLWDIISGTEFTDSPVHLTGAGNERLAAELVPFIGQP